MWQSKYVPPYLSGLRSNDLYPCPSQLRFTLSSANVWREVDIDFSYSEFYKAIVDYFEVMPGPVARARIAVLLAWWNQCVESNTGVQTTAN